MCVCILIYEGVVCYLLIVIPLHAARMAMAAAGFYKMSITCLRLTWLVIVRLPSLLLPNRPKI